MISNVSQGSILGPVLANIIINGLGSEAECTLEKFSNDTKLGGVADVPESWFDIWRELNRLEKWASWNATKFSKGK